MPKSAERVRVVIELSSVCIIYIVDNISHSSETSCVSYSAERSLKITHDFVSELPCNRRAELIGNVLLLWKNNDVEHM